MTRSVLLDLDGTLVDSYPGILASCHAALRALGHKPDESFDIRRIIGPPLEENLLPRARRCRAHLKPLGEIVRTDGEL